MSDSPRRNILEHFWAAFKFIDRGQTAVWTLVLVHCAEGRNRSAAFVIGYRMVRESLTLCQACMGLQHRRAATATDRTSSSSLVLCYRPCVANTLPHEHLHSISTRSGACMKQRHGGWPWLSVPCAESNAHEGFHRHPLQSACSVSRCTLRAHIF